MTELVMLDLPAGQAFVDAIERTWARGDAVFPLDQRLPAAEVDRILQVVRPTAVVEADGARRSLVGGLGLERGDALVVATSGTTGEPKAVIHTHDSVAASAWATTAGLGAQPGTDCWLACLPPAHIGGLSVITRALITGTDLIVHDRFDPDAVDRAAAEGATLVSLVTRALNQVDTASFRKILIGGAAPPPDLPPNVIATYGMTETGSGCVYDGYPLPGVELRIGPHIEDQNGNGQTGREHIGHDEVGRLHSGEIEIRADLLLRAYRTSSGEVDPRRAGGWFPTGDLGRLDPDGRIWVHGRAGDVIVTGGEKVWANRVERLLESHPAVAEVAIVAERDPEWGHRVVAFVVATSGHEEPGLEELRDHVRASMPVWNAPKELVVLPALPKTALGKVRKSELRSPEAG